MNNGYSLTPEDLEFRRAQKLKTRRYFTVSLSDRVVVEGEEFRCHKCGKVVTTVYNEPAALVEIKIIPQDAQGKKLVGSLCRIDNIMFLMF